MSGSQGAWAVGAVAWMLAGLACSSRAPVLAPAEPPEAEAEPVEHPQAQARELYRIAEARFADGDAAGAAGVLAQALAAAPDDVDPVLRHQLEARLTHMQLTAWQSSQDLELVIEARQRVLSRLAAFPTVVESLNAEQADRMRDELFEQLADVDGQLEAHLAELGAAPSEDELQILTAAAQASAPSKPEATRQSKDTIAADGTRTRKISVAGGRASPLDDPEVRARFNGGFNSQGFYLTRGVDMINGPRGVVRVLKADDAKGRGARARAAKFVAARRQALLACYDDAFAREPVFALQLQVAVSPDGSATRGAAVTEGALIDAAGNACVEAALTSAADDGASIAPASVRLLFFREETKFIHPETGEIFGGAGPSKAPEPDRVEQQKFAPMPSR